MKDLGLARSSTALPDPLAACRRGTDGDFVSTWKTLIEFQDDGRARSIGVSNFQPDHLARLAAGDRRGSPR
jgi:diketogulonate reductase-like aldo/keto reductase